MFVNNWLHGCNYVPRNMTSYLIFIRRSDGFRTRITLAGYFLPSIEQMAYTTDIVNKIT